MKLKLFLLLALLACLPSWAQTGLKGVVIDAKSGQPVAGVTVLLDNQGITVTTGPNGDFSISGAAAGQDVLYVLGTDHKDWSKPVELLNNVIDNMGTIKVEPIAFNSSDDYTYGNDVVLTESQLEDEEGNTQAVGTLAGANDNPFYQAASYDFSLMRFRMRGYNSEYTSTSINGINFNDAIRGRFNYSMMGGLNQAFKSKSTGIGLDATSFAFGEVGGATNINTYAKDYAPGFRGSVAFTNGNYMWRGMATYSTGLNKDGWALTASAVGRYAKEGIVPGSFYNSAGYFLAVQKVVNPQHSFAFTTFGAPTSRASNSAVVQEAYDLAGTNLYNSNWGYQNGKKRNARTVESFDPTALLNWLWTPSVNTTLNTGVAFHKSFYSSTALNWFNAPDPRPDYYRYLPSYFSGETAEFYTELWKNNEDVRQINWDNLYYVNYLNNYEAEQKGSKERPAATYSLEKRHSNMSTFAINTNLNTRLNDKVTLQGGANASYSRSSYYKTMADLLGGDHWLDVDQYAERDFPSNPEMAQNDLDHPNRKIYKGDRFGYDYDINSINANVWNQIVINLPKWDFNYSLKASYTSYQRDGKMRNGRAPENSLGKGAVHEYINAAIKAGATFKIDGRNNIRANVYYGSRAPLPQNAYVSPRIKDDVITNLKSENIFSADLSYSWHYRSFQGVITGFYTDQRNGTERYSYYDDQYSTFMNYALTNVHKVYKGVELGLAYKLTSSLTLSGAVNFARYQYKNRPTGTRSYENGTEADITKTVYLKNFYVSGTPQEAYTVSLNWAAPKMWFFEISASYMDKAYIDLSPIRHEQMDELYTMAGTEEELIDMMKSISKQEKLNSAFVMGASIGHVIYLNRRASLNLNLNVDNMLNNKKIMTGGYQQGRFDYKNYTTGKFPNKYYYAQGIKIYFNVGVRF